jgi:predicted lipoprotein with Yx(FWY)xxD motif
MMAAIATTLAAAAPAAQPADRVSLEVRESPQHGAYLTANGRAVYLFTADVQGRGSAVSKSNCMDRCAEVWPPVTTTADPQTGDRVQGTKIDTIDHQGRQQVSYNGWPLYYFVKDEAPGSVTGHDKRGFGGEWYLVAPTGEKAEGAGAAAGDEPAQKPGRGDPE